MTVAELREALTNYGADWPVYIETADEISPVLRLDNDCFDVSEGSVVVIVADPDDV